MLNSPDYDGLNDRQLFDFPPEREVFLKDLKVPLPTDIPTLKRIFEIISENTIRMGETTYTLDEQALEVFAEVHDDLCGRRLRLQTRMHRESCQNPVAMQHESPW